MHIYLRRYNKTAGKWGCREFRHFTPSDLRFQSLFLSIKTIYMPFDAVSGFRTALTPSEPF